MHYGYGSLCYATYYVVHVLQCSAGTISATGATTCTDCQAGKYATGATACTDVSAKAHMYTY